MFSARRSGFADSFRCHSVSLLAAETQRDPTRLEYSDKIILPPSCLEKLAHLEVQYPLMFEVTNPRYVARRLHCGVLEFIAQEGMVYLPFWMMENMHLNEGDIVHLKSATIQKGKFVKLQPQTTDFIKISNPKAVLESSLRNFSALTKGETFRILYNKKKYDIGVVEVRPEGAPFAPGAPEAVCIIEADVEVDFEAPADYVEPQRPSPQSASPLSTSPLSKSPLAGPALGAPVLDGDSSDEEMADAKPFQGSGFRLDGKPIKAPKAPKAGAGASLLSPGGSGVSVGINLGAGQTLGGGSGQALGGGQTLNGMPPPPGGSSAGLGSGQPLGSFAPPPDGFRRLGLAAKDEKKGDDYWANLSGGNKLR